MLPDNLYRTESEKSTGRFVRDLFRVVEKNGFVIHNETTMDMAHSFGKHGAEVAAGFDLHMIQVCKPEKAAKSLSMNPERAVLMPKFIMAFSRNGRTQIRFLRYSRDNIRNIVDDDDFPASLAETYAKIVSMIEESR
jgi:uncharacterized protein (DUF302 family)